MLKLTFFFAEIAVLSFAILSFSQRSEFCFQVTVKRHRVSCMKWAQKLIEITATTYSCYVAQLFHVVILQTLSFKTCQLLFPLQIRIRLESHTFTSLSYILTTSRFRSCMVCGVFGFLFFESITSIRNVWLFLYKACVEWYWRA